MVQPTVAPTAPAPPDRSAGSALSEPAIRRRRPPAPLVVAGLAVAAGALLPFAYLVIRAADAGLSGAVEIATGSRSTGLLGRSTLLAVLVTGACVLVALPLAWLTTRTDLPGRRVWAVLTALPLVIPSYIAAYALIGATGPAGVVTGWLSPLGVDDLPRVQGLGGAWLVLTLVSYPYVLLPVRAAWVRLDPALEDASRSLGHGARRTFFRVVLPQLRPAIGAGALLVALYALSDFGAVSLTRYDTFTRAIFIEYQSSFDRTPAAVLGLVLVALCLAVMMGETRIQGGRTYHGAHGGADRPARLVDLGRWRWPAVTGMVVTVAATLALPVSIVVGWLVRGLERGEPLRLTWEAAGHSLEAGAIAAAVALVVAWPVAYLGARHPGRLASFTERSSFVGYALPGVVVALSLVFFGARVVPAVYQTRALLTFGYVVLFLPMAIGALRTSLLQLSPSLEEASRSLGHGWWTTLWRVVVPMVRPGALAGYALVMLTVMKELPATLLLAPIGFDTLATQIWGASAEAFFARAAAPALMLVLLSSVPLAVLVTRESGAA